MSAEDAAVAPELATGMATQRVHGWNQRVGNVWHVAERLAPDPSAFPVAEAMAADMLTLPSHPWMTAEDINRVADAVVKFYRE